MKATVFLAICGLLLYLLGCSPKNRPASVPYTYVANQTSVSLTIDRLTLEFLDTTTERGQARGSGIFPIAYGKNGASGERKFAGVTLDHSSRDGVISVHLGQHRFQIIEGGTKLEQNAVVYPLNVERKITIGAPTGPKSSD